GLWDHWADKEGKEVRTFTIITTDANTTLAPIHERMPVILKPEDEAGWLDPESKPETLQKMLAPYPEGPLEAYAITKIVNSPRNDTAECFEPA
ncbi:MAG TPA: SOS response-associated peptidase family protein, partial [Nitrospiria bacterium]|nr:SOS response-associated peptidase family protein [Nitrospiria bacterium]